MKIVTAIIRPFVLDKVRDALTAIGIQGLTASEVKGFGRQRGHAQIYQGDEYSVKFIPKIKIELLVKDDMAEQVIEAVRESACTGKTGDGKIYCQDVPYIMRIRTGETDDGAL